MATYQLKYQPSTGGKVPVEVCNAYGHTIHRFADHGDRKRRPSQHGLAVLVAYLNEHPDANHATLTDAMAAMRKWPKSHELFEQLLENNPYGF